MKTVAGDYTTSIRNSIPRFSAVTILEERSSDNGDASFGSLVGNKTESQDRKHQSVGAVPKTEGLL